MSIFNDWVFEAGVVARSLADYFTGDALRLGVTGLSRSGKTVFITALVNNLIAGGKLPVLRAAAEGALRGSISIRSLTTRCRVSLTRSIWRRSLARIGAGRFRRSAFRNCG